jgi:hypothetical protein
MSFSNRSPFCGDNLLQYQGRKDKEKKSGRRRGRNIGRWV